MPPQRGIEHNRLRSAVRCVTTPSVPYSNPGRASVDARCGAAGSSAPRCRLLPSRLRVGVRRVRGIGVRLCGALLPVVPSVRCAASPVPPVAGWLRFAVPVAVPSPVPASCGALAAGSGGAVPFPADRVALKRGLAARFVGRHPLKPTQPTTVRRHADSSRCRCRRRSTVPCRPPPPRSPLLGGSAVGGVMPGCGAVERQRHR